LTEYIRQVVLGFWDTLGEMSPYLLFGFFVAGLLSVLISQEAVQRHLGGRGIWPLFKASIFGVPLPLCSCGVIPVAMSLHRHGASRGSTISFLLSTPQTGVDSILVTLSLLGPVFAIFRPVVALVTGIIGGALVNVFAHRGDDAEVPDKCTGACCAEHPNILSKVSHGMRYGFVTLPRDIGPAILVGLIIAALISAFVPENFFAEYLGTGFFAMVVMMLAGIPVYVCASASVPVAAALILKGITPGAALVFLMTGPATNAASFVTIYKTLGRPTAITYILTVAGCALLSGLLLDAVWRTADFQVIMQHARMLPDAVKYVSAVALLGILGFAVATKKKHHN
jgi:uncharacterized membrane protein YraQ (UPF0718 family)